MHHKKCDVDRRAVRVKLTDKGQELRALVSQLFERHADGMRESEVLNETILSNMIGVLRRLERYWTDQIRYIY